MLNYKMGKKLFLFIIFVFCLFACGPSLKELPITQKELEAERRKEKELALLTYIQRFERLYRISLPLMVSASPFCDEEERKLICGILVHEKDDYKKEDREIIALHFPLGNIPTILYIHPDFPASKIGLKPGDKILKVNYKKIKNSKDFYKTLLKIDPDKTQIVPFVVERNGKILKLDVPCLKGCYYPLRLIIDDSVNAWVDTRKRINITTGLMRFVNSDEELALVIGHELAHNVLNHLGKKIKNQFVGTMIDTLLYFTAKINTRGVLGRVSNFIYSKEFEKEADYLGTYIVARAGYDVSQATNIWRRIAAEYPKNINRFFLSTHPSTPERFLYIEKTAEEIKKKKELGLPLLPEKRKKNGFNLFAGEYIP